MWHQWWLSGSPAQNQPEKMGLCGTTGAWDDHPTCPGSVLHLWRLLCVPCHLKPGQWTQEEVAPARPSAPPAWLRRELTAVVIVSSGSARRILTLPIISLYQIKHQPSTEYVDIYMTQIAKINRKYPNIISCSIFGWSTLSLNNSIHPFEERCLLEPVSPSV